MRSCEIRSSRTYLSWCARASFCTRLNLGLTFLPIVFLPLIASSPSHLSLSLPNHLYPTLRYPSFFPEFAHQIQPSKTTCILWDSIFLSLPTMDCSDNPYGLLFEAISMIPISHYALGLLCILIVVLYNFLEFHLLEDLLTGFRGSPVSLTYNSCSEIYEGVASKCKILHGRYVCNCPTFFSNFDFFWCFLIFRVMGWCAV